VLEGEKLCLLPAQGSGTQWYKNVLHNPSIRIDARGVGAGFRAVPVTDANAVKSVIEKFREKYGAKDVKKSTLTDTTLIIRCPHCMAGIEFRPMIAYKDGRFVCRDCAHTLFPGVPEYKCTCRPCLRLSRKPLLTDHGSHLLTQ
jgi:hypothetical protein